MTAVERRQYEMLLRVRSFSTTYGELFAACPAAPDAFAAVNAAVDQLKATAQSKLSAAQAGRAGRKRKTRKALIELLVDVGRLAHVLRTRGLHVAAFSPLQSKSAHVLLTTARQFATDAKSFEAEFGSHGMGSAVIGATADAFEKAVRDRDMKRLDHLEARTRIRALIASALLDVRRLDLIMRRELGGVDNPVRAVWKQARHVERPRRGRGADEAAMIDMPSRDAA